MRWGWLDRDENVLSAFRIDSQDSKNIRFYITYILYQVRRQILNTLTRKTVDTTSVVIIKLVPWWGQAPGSVLGAWELRKGHPIKNITWVWKSSVQLFYEFSLHRLQSQPSFPWASKELECVTHRHVNDCWLLQSLFYFSTGLWNLEASEEWFTSIHLVCTCVHSLQRCS